MEDALAMNVFQRHYDATDEELGLLLSEFPMSRNVVAEVTPSQQVHHEVQVFSILERVLHVHYEATRDKLLSLTHD